MKLWLDDLRKPWEHGCIGFEWAKTADEAIALLKTGRVTFASLDHDLSEKATLGDWEGEQTGYEVLLWMEANGVWPRDGVEIHTLNPAGRERMARVIKRAYMRRIIARDAHQSEGSAKFRANSP